MYDIKIPFSTCSPNIISYEEEKLWKTMWISMCITLEKLFHNYFIIHGEHPSEGYPPTYCAVLSKISTQH